PATALRARAAERGNLSVPSATSTTEAAARAVVDANYGKLPLSFEINRGQANPDIIFLSRAGGSSLLLKPTEAVLMLSREEKRETPPKTSSYPMLDEPAVRRVTSTVTMKLIGANPNPRIVGLDEQQAKSSYFTGNDPKQWMTDVPNYARVKYEQVYPGIDLIFYGNPQQLEYDFVVAPGTDPKQIKLSFDGAQKMKLDANGDLLLATKAGELRQHKPVMYQEVNGERREVAGRYLLKNNQLGFEIGAYDASKPLVIDPVFAYATFFGVTPATAIAVDAAGNAYVVGEIPATPGAFQIPNGFLSLTKLNATGTAVIYSATFSSNTDDRITDIAVDAAGNAYFTGYVKSLNFPTTPGAFQTSFGRTGNNFYNAFVTKLNAAGNALVYSTFLKGDTTFPASEPKVNLSEAIAVDAQGNAYVTGSTNATDFPVTIGAFQQNIVPAPPPFTYQDLFITKLNAMGTGLVYSTYLGSASNAERGRDITVDNNGNAYITGITANGYNDVRLPQGVPFPVTPGAYRTPNSGVFFIYAFVTKLNASGTALTYSTLLGAVHSSGEPTKIAIDNAQNAYVSGVTSSATFPTTPGSYQTAGGGKSVAFPGDDNLDCFITKLNPAGSALIYSTYLGGNYVDRCFGFAVDAEGSAHIVGLTTSADFPQSGLPLQTIGIGDDSGGFVTKLDAAGSAVTQSIFIKRARNQAVAVDTIGNAYATGTGGLLQPTPNAYQATPSGQLSGFVAKITSPRSFATVSAASYTAELASEVIASAFGSGLAAATQVATATPLPTTLAGVTVKVRDGAGAERNAPLFFVSPTQINYLVPAGTANGTASISINNGNDVLALATTRINPVAPGLFTANASGQGLAAAVALRVKADGTQTFEPISRFDAVQGQLVAVPIDLGSESDQVFLILYGTGVRFRSSLAAVNAKIGGVDGQVIFAGALQDFVGLDQLNVRLPRTLIGRGAVDVVLSVDGKAANTVRVTVK
ncbi:MAG TPA: SBBP repeat-containing protein, partial [Blastocatellia bacterium]|nr:SBBP repeat-containing protein [Blastocatellia bacterium]